MNKNILFSGFLLFTGLAMAHQSYVIRSPEESRSLMDNPIEIPQEMIDLADERKSLIKQHGYIPMYSRNAAMLMTMKDTKGTHESVPEDIPNFEILRLNMLDFKLTFPFQNFTSISKQDLIGYGPSGGYVSETGEWTGLTAYFTNANLGVCRMIIWDMQSSNGQSIYDPKYVTFGINKKPTFTSAQGNQDSGFFYEVSWTGQRYEKMIDCANKKPFDRKTIKDLILLAKKIDNDLPDSP